MFIDFILPDTLDPAIKLIVNILVGLHLFAFIIYLSLLVRSFGQKPEDKIKDFARKNGKMD